MKKYLPFLVFFFLGNQILVLASIPVKVLLSCEEALLPRTSTSYTLLLYHTRDALKRHETVFLRHWMTVHQEDLLGLSVRSRILLLDGMTYPSWACCNVPDREQTELGGCVTEPVLILYDPQGRPLKVLERPSLILPTILEVIPHPSVFIQRLRDEETSSLSTFPLLSTRPEDGRLLLAVLPLPNYEDHLLNFQKVLQEHDNTTMAFRYTKRARTPLLMSLGVEGKPAIPLYYIIQRGTAIKTLSSLKEVSDYLQHHG